jgi:hypothetical protein
MRRLLRIAAVFVVLAALAAWAATGANRGWTKTTHTRMEKDPVTEIEYPVTEKRFLPGIDVLAGAFLVAALLGISSVVVPKKNNK